MVRLKKAGRLRALGSVPVRRNEAQHGPGCPALSPWRASHAAGGAASRGGPAWLELVFLFFFFLFFAFFASPP